VDILADLNPAQKQAVEAPDGPLLILAGPGSGKTRVITHRIAYLIRVRGVRPHRIMAVTFTNKAAREMSERLSHMVSAAMSDLTLGTFHAICARILRRDGHPIGVEPHFVIYDDQDGLSLVKRSLQALNIDPKQYAPASICNAISAAKSQAWVPTEYIQRARSYFDEIVGRVYEQYQKLLDDSNAVDFDDLLMKTVLLFRNNPDVLEKYQSRYLHLLVDEFQDTNTTQYELIKQIGGKYCNICVVGDPDQSIYSWRQADLRNILSFEHDFPEAGVILLEQNYRSTQQILDVAMAVIDPNPNRIPKQLFTDRSNGLKVMLHETYDDRQEASFVVDTIASLVSRRQVKPGDVAVMYRTNAQSRLLEEAFLHAGLPYKLVGAQRFYGRREVKDIIAYMRLVHNLDDELSLIRVINIPPRGVGEKTLQLLRTQAQKAGLTPGNLLIEMSHNPDAFSAALPARALGLLSGFGELIARLVKGATELSTLSIMDRILEEIDYHAYIDDGTDEGTDRWENVMELRRLAAEYQDRTLSDFLENIALVSDQDTIEASANAPTLLTLHAAKGLEYPVVFIVGLNEGTLPHSRSFDDFESMQEERRLLYVGITRAKDRLYLVFSFNRSAFGYPEPVEPSRFLDDIPDELLDDSTTMRNCHSDRLRGYNSKATQWETKLPSAAKVTAQKFRPGTHVQHPVWGDGMVLSSRLQDDDEIVDIFFENIGMKRVAASLANLKSKG
jgi:DNA helicase-2/ATP-dependent DNA helicase PcrA